MSTFKFKDQTAASFSSTPPSALVRSGPIFTHKFPIKPVMSSSVPSRSASDDMDIDVERATAGSYTRDIQMGKYNVKLASQSNIKGGLQQFFSSPIPAPTFPALTCFLIIDPALSDFPALTCVPVIDPVLLAYQSQYQL
ncbi:hypothetical protein C8J56DRAFT_1058444 [Mycena floridula]|nr:hypothetical protein C8J56DRAFT_1058444 [Mycena floridula]